MNDMKPLLQCTVEALEAGAEMEQAVIAAAKLLMHCSCQNARKAEALEAVRLADNSVARWQAAVQRMKGLVRSSIQ